MHISTLSSSIRRRNPPLAPLKSPSVGQIGCLASALGHCQIPLVALAAHPEPTALQQPGGSAGLPSPAVHQDAHSACMTQFTSHATVAECSSQSCQVHKHCCCSLVLLRRSVSAEPLLPADVQATHSTCMTQLRSHATVMLSSLFSSTCFEHLTCTSVHLCVCLRDYPSVHVSMLLQACPSVCLSICESVHL